MPALPVREFERRLDQLLAQCRMFVQMESPTTAKAAVDALGLRVAEELERLGAKVRRYPQTDAGDHWFGSWGGGDGGILLLAHLDTVYSLGTLERMPWREADGRAFGPGVFDMKASLAIALVAVETLIQTDRLPARRLSLLCTSDEETGSRTSRELIESLSPEYDLVLCLEPGLSDGGLKTRRKGVGVYELHVEGKAAHAGVNPEKGVNAIVEMAGQIDRLAGLANPGAGTTVNVGVIRGGTRSNVVPESCWAEIDVRAASAHEQSRVEAAIQQLAPVIPGAGLRLGGGWNRPPMERTLAVGRAFERARSIAAELGLDLTEGDTGGASDANFVAPLGVPILDGLGALGEGAHSLDEHILIESLPARAALLSALITEW